MRLIYSHHNPVMCRSGAGSFGSGQNVPSLPGPISFSHRSGCRGWCARWQVPAHFLPNFYSKRFECVMGSLGTVMMDECVVLHCSSQPWRRRVN